MKPIPLNSLLINQMIYCFAGVMYNVGSLLAQRNLEPAWASTDAVTGVARPKKGVCLKHPTFHRVSDKGLINKGSE